MLLPATIRSVSSSGCPDRGTNIARTDLGSPPTMLIVMENDSGGLARPMRREAICSQAPRLKGGSLKGGAHPAAIACAIRQIARTVLLPELFSPTNSVIGR